MSEMKKIRMGEASFNYSPETAYEKNGNVYCNTCHEQINGEVVNMMGTWMCFRIQCQCEKEEEKRWKERERVMRVNQLKDTCFTNPKQRNYTLDKLTFITHRKPEAIKSPLVLTIRKLVKS
ncbi:TPA: hypothetical protein ACGOST_001362 [Streptococcus suis]